MFKKFLNALSGDSNEKELKRLQPAIDEINSIEPDFERLGNEDLQSKTEEFKERLAAGEDIDDLLTEAFAAVRQASIITLGLRHFDSQLIGGIVLHEGKIAEMKTGEGKTLVATLPTYLNALTGEGVHVITVNDYLSKRDTHWMGAVYRALGMSVGCIQHESAFLFDPEFTSNDEAWPHLRPVPRKQAYEADITYGTNNEFGFDYLRDNMVVDLSQRVQRGFNYAIVDEVDNILIDEARTPLIISGQAEEPLDTYKTFSRLVPRLQNETDYTIDEKLRTAMLTEDGIAKMENLLGIPNLYDPSNYHLVHFMENALRAHVFYHRDKEYVVQEGEVIIVDEFTGRMMQGRRFSDGLHQAIEAQEGVKIQRESVTLATVTFQNYFRMYDKLAGMTGTAVTEAEEFHKIYDLDVVVIPTNKPLVRVEQPDQIYKNEEAKFRAVVREIDEVRHEGRPILVGTCSVEKSEKLSGMLNRKGIKHSVLNAKLHEKEATIVARAGHAGSVTIATNMAGRGVDIILGGNPEGRDQAEWQTEHENVLEAGGLHIIGTERHEARRIDNQLRGRAGRQGDAGSSRFFVSVEDDIMRRFGGDKIGNIMERFGFDEDTPIEHSMVSKAIENTQVKVEGHHFDIRKRLIDYDDVLNKQREIIYGEREKLLSGADLKANTQNMVAEAIKGIVHKHLPSDEPDEWHPNALIKETGAILPLPEDFQPDDLFLMSRGEIEESLLSLSTSLYEQREEQMGQEDMRMLERLIMLRAIDNHWKSHLTSLEEMRQGIGWQGLRQRDPLVAYKTEAFSHFQQLQQNIQRDIINSIYRMSLVKGQQQQPENKKRDAIPIGKKVGRNESCPCGSGKKYKKCCGKA